MGMSMAPCGGHVLRCMLVVPDISASNLNKHSQKIGSVSTRGRILQAELQVLRPKLHSKQKGGWCPTRTIYGVK